MNKKYILALDQGTTSSRSLLVNRQGEIVAIAQKEFPQIYPKPGWVEHNPMDIWTSQWNTILEVFAKAHTDWDEIVSIGITNQRETSLVWDRKTGEPLYNAIVWQDRRTAPICEELKNRGLESYVSEKTGLVIDSYFSGTKIKWILDHVPGAREKAENGELAFGTMDSWLVYKLTEGKRHVTDLTNASRTMLFDIASLKWDDTLLKELEIPSSMLPEVLPSSADFGAYQATGFEVPVQGIAGDQQAALFGQACFDPGTGKNTYGTGCFMLLNTGNKKLVSNNGLITTLACGVDNETTYALEGSVFIAGAAVQWLRDSLKIIEHAADTEKLAHEVLDSDEVIMVPAFAGLGAPHWDMYARGAIFGITRDTTHAHIAKAALQAMAYQTKDVLNAMSKDSGLVLQRLKVDGGAVPNNFLMQFQADILGVPVERPVNIESTAMGAAYLAGNKCGWWNKENIQSQRKIDTLFEPDFSQERREKLYSKWLDAVNRTKGWKGEQE